jgi:hypothetical protein
MSILEIIALVFAGLTALGAVGGVIVASYAVYETRRLVNSQIEWQQRVTEKQLDFQVVLEEWKAECEELKRLNPQERRPSLRAKLVEGRVYKQASNQNERKGQTGQAG